MNNTTKDNKMKAIVINKETGEKYEVRAEKVNKQWMIGGDVPEYKKFHYIIITENNEYTLRNGRLIQA